ncbi:MULTISPECIES: hypothetical protein [Klebsiella pneumoniae complex]|uniref:hypothetical protein n=1 Tax=Klebsiella pneumoniae complex TaxID=3390273 RepID=UPI0015F67CA5|nr:MULTISPECIES: hypothetical protein [Klebsiella]MDH2670224.1 hypothetical protein [Klebsiella quasipneumoniae]
MSITMLDMNSTSGHLEKPVEIDMADMSAANRVRVLLFIQKLRIRLMIWCFILNWVQSAIFDFDRLQR